MSIPIEQVHKFQELYRHHFGEELSDEVAYRKAIKLVRLMEIVLHYEADKSLKEKPLITN